MGDNTLGTRFKITSFGESHGDVIGIVIDGVPAGLDIDIDFIQSELDKRRPGQSNLTTGRAEPDKVRVMSGMFHDKATGAPLCLIIENKDVDSTKYEKFKNFLRPSQVDYTALKKYGGFADYRGSGRFSGRITASLVMAGAIAKHVLKEKKITIFAYTTSIGTLLDETYHDLNDVKHAIQIREKSPVRSLNPRLSKEMVQLIEDVRSQRDSVGGVIKCIVNSFPEGVGGPIFNGLESNISRAIFSIPSVKGIEFGAGFKATRMKGSEHNDPWVVEKGKIMTQKMILVELLGVFRRACLSYLTLQ